ncbi:MAG: citrate synthase [Acidimicrobiales bacterium]|jgi:citrate synthase
MAGVERMLESDEAARRLGVKVSTLYAYVSRGLLVSHRAASGRRSLFDMDEVERLARRSRQGKAVETRMVTVTTGITQLTDDGPIYRGRRATDLATIWRYEQVAEWLWSTGGHDREPRPDDWSPLALGRPPDLGPSDRIRWAVVMAGARDPLRADLRPETVVRTARRVTASMVDVLAVAVAEAGGRSASAAAGDMDLAGSMAAHLASALTADPTPDVIRAVNAAMVLMADHELATSTMAVRIAASTRADVYDAVLAGLGTIGGPLHGGASQLAYSLLVDAERDGPERALDDTLRWQGNLPGFGHTVYKHGDARFSVLLHLFEQLATPDQIRTVGALIELAAAHSIPLPNVDLGMAAIAWSTGMASDAGRTLFTVARVAGWVAHYLEELRERPLRYRARAVYATPGRH